MKIEINLYDILKFFIKKRGQFSKIRRKNIFSGKFDYFIIIRK